MKVGDLIRYAGGVERAIIIDVLSASTVKVFWFHTSTLHHENVVNLRIVNAAAR